MWTLQFWEWTFGREKWVIYDKFKIATNCVHQIFNLNAFFCFLLTGATWYHPTIYLVFTYFASFTDFEDVSFEVISNLHVEGYKFGDFLKKFGKNLKKVELHGVYRFSFLQVWFSVNFSLGKFNRSIRICNIALNMLLPNQTWLQTSKIHSTKTKIMSVDSQDQIRDSKISHKSRVWCGSGSEWLAGLKTRMDMSVQWRSRQQCSKVQCPPLRHSLVRTRGGNWNESFPLHIEEVVRGGLEIWVVGWRSRWKYLAWLSKLRMPQ